MVRVRLVALTLAQWWNASGTIGELWAESGELQAAELGNFYHGKVTIRPLWAPLYRAKIAASGSNSPVPAISGEWVGGVGREVPRSGPLAERGTFFGVGSAVCPGGEMVQSSGEQTLCETSPQVG